MHWRTHPYLCGIIAGLIPVVLATLPLLRTIPVGPSAYLALWGAAVVCILTPEQKVRSLGKGLFTAAVLDIGLYAVIVLIDISVVAPGDFHPPIKRRSLTQADKADRSHRADNAGDLRSADMFAQKENREHNGENWIEPGNRNDQTGFSALQCEIKGQQPY